MKLIDKIIYKFLGAKLTFSQLSEDRILEHLFKYSYGQPVSYLDIGANDSKRNNNTYLFYRQGCRGVLIEPNPLLCKKLKKTRKRDVIMNVGIGSPEQNGSRMTYYMFNAHTLNTFSEEEKNNILRANEYKLVDEKQIDLVSINSLFEKYKNINLVSVDVEGWNYEILKDIDFGKYRPFCFCVETLTFSPQGRGEKIREIIDLFEKNNYQIYAETNLNTIFIDKMKQK